jgi:hypothetical protein
MNIYQENGRNIIAFVLLDSKLHFLHLSLCMYLYVYVQLNCFNETAPLIATMLHALKISGSKSTVFILVYTHVQLLCMIR